MKSSVNYYIEKCENGFSISRYKDQSNHPIREFASKLGYKEIEIPYDKIWNVEVKNIITNAISG